MTRNEIAELEVQESINRHVDAFKSFRFNAGAGAGKTYALTETLKYITVNKIAVTKSPQKVACITYTNVAVDEIKSRLGNSETVHVSTIHERLWQLIKMAQPQLLMCHKEKIVEVINQYDQDLNDSGNKKTKFFAELNESQKQEFVIFAMKTKELFYQSKRLKAPLFEQAYTDNTEINESSFLPKCLHRNVGNFKSTVALLYKKQRLKECLERINAGKEKRVAYDSKVNLDRLHYMKFSHDTLLEYGLKLVERYPTLCRIIIDSYPFFLIDEYQDTHSNVVKFIKVIHNYVIENKKSWMVGYFGDTAQSIYEDGVGRKISDFHDGLVDVNKIFNRRSHQQIIDVANNIRSDEIVQLPIFEGRNSGSVRFFYNDSDDMLITAKEFLTEYKNDLIKDKIASGDMDNEDAKIHCLVLTNKLMASFNEFGEVYEVFQKSMIYHDNLNTQVLSQQLEKLHPTVLTIYNFIKFYQDIQDGTVSYYDIFGESSKNLAFFKASLIIRELKNNGILSLKCWLDLIVDRLKNSDAKEALANALIHRVNFEPDKVISADIFQTKLLDDIANLMNDDSEDEDKAKAKIDSVLELPINSLTNWVNHVAGVEAHDISYHTYHGTKGEEYKNVAVILGHSFGRLNKDKFKNYFNIVQQDTKEREGLLSDPQTEKEHVNTQNLLYVACSRAIKNLRVLYLDDISEINKGIEAIFGDTKSWPDDGNHGSA